MIQQQPCLDGRRSEERRSPTPRAGADCVTVQDHKNIRSICRLFVGTPRQYIGPPLQFQERTESKSRLYWAAGQ